MIRRRILVVLARITSIRELVARRIEQDTAIECGCETGNDCVARLVRACGEGAGGTGEDVAGRWGGKRAGFAEDEFVVGDAASEVTSCGLRVDGEVFVLVFCPDGGGVAVPVTVPCCAVADEEVVGAENAERLAVDFVDELVPGATVGLRLSTQSADEGIEAVRSHAWHCLGVALAISQGQCDGNANKVDVGDICEELRVIVGKFAKGPVDVVVRIGRVCHAGLDDSWTWVQEESQLGVNAEPDASTSDLGNFDVDSVARRTEWDRNIGLERLLDLARRNGVVDALPIGLYKDGRVILL